MADAREPLDRIAEEYVGRLRRGETPSVEEFVERYPDIADELADLLPPDPDPADPHHGCEISDFPEPEVPASWKRMQDYLEEVGARDGWIIRHNLQEQEKKWLEEKHKHLEAVVAGAKAARTAQAVAHEHRVLQQHMFWFWRWNVFGSGDGMF